MIQVEVSVAIQRPPEAVFAFASDPRNSRSWQWEIVRATSGASARRQPAPRSTVTRRTRRESRPGSCLAEITLFEASRRLGIRQCSEDIECDAVYHFDAGNGGTCVTWTGRVAAGGRYRPIEALIGQAIATEAEVSLELLKIQLEAEPVAIPTP